MELEAQEADGYAFVALWFGFTGTGIETEPTFDIKTTERFLTQLRNEVVRAKQKNWSGRPTSTRRQASQRDTNDA